MFYGENTKMEGKREGGFVKSKKEREKRPTTYRNPESPP